MAERCAWERRLEPERGRARLSDGCAGAGPWASEPCRESAAETEHMTRTNAVREGVRAPRRTVASAVPTSGETVSRRSCDSLCSFASDPQRMRQTVARHANVRHQLGKRVIHTRAASWCTAVNDVDSRQNHQRTRWSGPRGCKRCEGSPGAMRHMAPCGFEGPSRGPLVRLVAPFLSVLAAPGSACGAAAGAGSESRFGAPMACRAALQGPHLEPAVVVALEPARALCGRPLRRPGVAVRAPLWQPPPPRLRVGVSHRACCGCLPALGCAYEPL